MSGTRPGVRSARHSCSRQMARRIASRYHLAQRGRLAEAAIAGYGASSREAAALERVDRAGRIAHQASSVNSTPLNRMLPEAASARRMMAMAVDVLPQPDSPTIANVRPFSSSKETPSPGMRPFSAAFSLDLSSPPISFYTKTLVVERSMSSYVAKNGTLRSRSSLPLGPASTYRLTCSLSNLPEARPPNAIHATADVVHAAVRHASASRAVAIRPKTSSTSLSSRSSRRRLWSRSGPG